MAAYRVDLPDGAHEVTAVFRGRTSEEPQRVVMRLEGHHEVQYSIVRLRLSAIDASPQFRSVQIGRRAAAASLRLLQQ